MKKLQHYCVHYLVKISFLCYLLFGQHLSAQINCNAFCIKNVSIDTVSNPNKLSYTISFNGNSTQFINYPFIAALTNLNSDTVGTGTLSFFGQIGGTDETYEVSTNLDSIPTDFLLHFSFDTSVCIFNNFCAPTSLDLEKKDEIRLFYNARENIIFTKQEFFFNEAIIQIHDINGRIITKAFVQKSFSEHVLTDLKSGIYVFSLHWDNKKIFLKFLRP